MKSSTKDSTKDSVAMGKAKFTQKVKYNVYEDEFAIAAVEWSADRPKPEFTPGAWPEDVIEDLARYADWHRQHPNCASPRALLDDEGAFGDRKIDEGNPKLFYTGSGSTAPPPLPREFQPTGLGLDCDVDEVTSVAMSYEYSERLRNQYDNEDPWYTMSVKDNLETSHMDGDHTTLSWATLQSKRSQQTTASQFSKEAAWQKQQYGQYEGGYPEVSRNYLDKLADLALADKSILHPHLSGDKVGPWANELKFSRYTEKGTALDAFNEERLSRSVSRALQVHKKDVYRESVKMGLIERKSKREREQSNKSNKSGMFGFGSSSKKSSSKIEEASAPTVSRVSSMGQDSFKVMRDNIGDDKHIEKMSFDFVKVAKYIAKKAKIQKSAVDAQMDLVEACRKLRIMKVRAMLLSKEIDPNMLTPEDEPIFVHMFERAVRMDMNSGYVRIRHAHQDSADRKKLGRLLSVLAGREDLNLNSLDGKDGYAPVHLAAAGDNSKLISWLFRHKADFELFSRRDDMTPLMVAAKFGHVELMSEIVRKHIPMDTANASEGMTALHYAAQFGQTRAAMFLLRVGASKVKQDKKGRTAAEVANEMKFLATAQSMAAFAAEKPAVGTQLQFFMDTEVQESIKRSQRQIAAKKSTFSKIMDLNNLSAGATAVASILGQQARVAAKALHRFVRAKLFPNTVYVEEDEEDDGGFDSEEEEEEELLPEEARSKRESQKKLIDYSDPFSISRKKPNDGVIVSDKIIWQRMSEKKAKEDAKARRKAAIEEEILAERAAREAARKGAGSSIESNSRGSANNNDTKLEITDHDDNNNNGNGSQGAAASMHGNSGTAAKIKSSAVIPFNDNFAQDTDSA